MELTVKPLREENVGNGLAAVDIAAMSRMDLLSGEFVEVTSDEGTVLPRVWPGYPEDEGTAIVRLDADHRDELEVDVDDVVDVAAASPTPADAVLVGVEEPFASLSSFEHSLLADLEDCHLAAGTTIATTYEGAPERESIPVAVAATRPEGVVRVTNDTELEVRAYDHAGRNEGPGARDDEPSGGDDGASGGDRAARSDGGETKVQSGGGGTDVQRTRPGTTYADVGGLDEAMQRVRELVELPFQRPDLFDDLGVDPPTGVLLHGPPGTGKTLLARAVANEVDAEFVSLPAAEVMSRYYGESEEYLREVFEEAEENAPAVVFIDEVDAITPERSEAAGDVERRVVAQLLTLMDGLDQTAGVVVIAATNRPDAIDPALRRGGRFDREVEVSIPDRDEREEVLAIHARDVPLADDVDLESIADSTHGFVGSDLASVVQEAAMAALQRSHDGDLTETSPRTAPEVTAADFRTALEDADPSALRDMQVEVPTVTWEDVGGLGSVKRTLREAVEWPLKYPTVLDQAGLDTTSGVLLYGPPGAGKTMLARAVATESECNLLSIQGPELLSKWVGESESRVRDVFERARKNAPAIVLFDEIDAVAAERGRTSGSGVGERVVGQLLTELDGLGEAEDVLVVATTNRPSLIDDALLRPGRIERQCHVPVPDERARREIFDVQTADVPLAAGVDLGALAARTDGYVGADIEAICRTASARATRSFLESHESPASTTADPTAGAEATAGAEGTAGADAVDGLTVDRGDFEAALDEVDPSVTDRTRERYADYRSRQRQQRVDANTGAGFQ
ncbi:AAA family ATPase [Halorubellus sp. JP-L1]|uniref:AAA family ATPase n=1 Tax=Halorubellus sp. JP-L1 TaxID=2715753 RepID=UPI00140D5D7C|nr:AAA family ATPase [Halorubellus sp. JP-L1]NHN43136.1 AAA family ATPase [Halorubellus sp. JP-L1]